MGLGKIIFGLGIFLLGGLALYIGLSDMETDTYVGKMLMSDTQYSDFKQAITSPSVVVNDLNELTFSENPYVSFSVSVPNGYNFGYGAKSSNYNELFTVGVGLIIGLFGCGVCFSGIIDGLTTPISDGNRKEGGITKHDL